MRQILIPLLAVLALSCARDEQARSAAATRAAPGAGAAPVAAATAAPAEHRVITPEDIAWRDTPALPPGAQVAILEGDPTKEGLFTMRAKLPEGFRIPPHWHPSSERVTVLSGTFHLGHGDSFDTSAARTLPAGSYSTMPPGMRHFAWAEGETIIQVTTTGPWGITYVNPSDDPRNRPSQK